MKKTSPSSTVPVSDFYLAAYLICQGMELLRADPHNPHRVTFLLKDSPGRARLVQDFYGRRAKVDPIAFKSVIVDLKSFFLFMRTKKINRTPIGRSSFWRWRGTLTTFLKFEACPKSGNF